MCNALACRLLRKGERESESVKSFAPEPRRHERGTREASGRRTLGVRLMSRLGDDGARSSLHPLSDRASYAFIYLASAAITHFRLSTCVAARKASSGRREQRARWSASETERKATTSVLCCVPLEQLGQELTRSNSSLACTPRSRRCSESGRELAAACCFSHSATTFSLRWRANRAKLSRCSSCATLKGSQNATFHYSLQRESTIYHDICFI